MRERDWGRRLLLTMSLQERGFRLFFSIVNTWHTISFKYHLIACSHFWRGLWEFKMTPFFIWMVKDDSLSLTWWIGNVSGEHSHTPIHPWWVTLFKYWSAGWWLLNDRVRTRGRCSSRVQDLKMPLSFHNITLNMWMLFYFEDNHVIYKILNLWEVKNSSLWCVIIKFVMYKVQVYNISGLHKFNFNRIFL